MAKELPYFRFTVSEWLNDDISLESYETKGVFIDVCSFYWFKDCSITIAMLNKRFRDATEVLQELRDLDIIKYNTNDTVTIVFLDDQFDMLSEKRLKRQLAGSKGGKKKSSNATAMLKQSSSYKDNNKDKEKDKKKIKSKEFYPPDVLEVIAYFKEKGYTEGAAIKAFNYYDAGEWKDSTGKNVKSWKQKMNGVWFKEENSIKSKDKQYGHKM